MLFDVIALIGVLIVCSALDDVFYGEDDEEE